MSSQLQSYVILHFLLLLTTQYNAHDDGFMFHRAIVINVLLVISLTRCCLIQSSIMYLRILATKGEPYGIPQTHTHKRSYVTTMIKDSPSRNHFLSVDIPPCRPKIAPIEYVFCELALELSMRCEREWSTYDLHRNIFDIYSTIRRKG